MGDFISWIIDFVEKHLGSGGFCVFVVVLAAIYIWFAYHKNKLLEERLLLEKEKKRKAAEDFAVLAAVAPRLVQPGEARPTPQLASGKKRILVADDEESIRNVIGEILRRELPGLLVSFAADGEETLRRLRSDTFSLLILDLIMPRLSGYEVLAEVAEKMQPLPVLIISGYSDSREQIALKARVSVDRFEFLRKPFEKEELLHVVRMLIRD